jgi:protein involved in polysaccharide export with SLBB domain
LLADRNPAAQGPDALAGYVVHCPDVLEVTVDGRPGWSGQRPIGADGRITLGDGVAPRIEGHTPPEIVRVVAERAGVSPGRVHVGVAAFKSQQLYVFGEVAGLQRAVPYRGPETVVELLQRVGGITPSAAVGDVQIVRAHVADGTAPEVFPVDLAAILLKKDQQTNVRLEPFDQIYVGQTRGGALSCCVPPWLRPLVEALCGMRRPTPAAPLSVVPTPARFAATRQGSAPVPDGALP